MLAEHIKAGRHSGCPFCIAREDLLPPVGTELVFLKGFEAGHVGTVTDNQGPNLSNDFFLVQMKERQRPGDLRITNKHSDVYMKNRLFRVPDWAAPLSVEDNYFVHEAMINVFTYMNRRDFFLNPIIYACWKNRLPISSTELGRFFRAHSCTKQINDEISGYFKSGISLLVYAEGRPAIRRRRIEPMSEWRYTPKVRKSGQPKTT